MVFDRADYRHRLARLVRDTSGRLIHPDCRSGGGIAKGPGEIHTSAMSGAILIFGSFNLDFTFRAARFPGPGETLPSELTVAPGGKGANQAVAAARSGAPVLFVGGIGTDNLGASAREVLAGEGIEAHLVEYPDAHTGAAGIVLDRSGENRILVALGANRRIRASDVPRDYLRRASILLCQAENDPIQVTEMLEAAKDAGLTTIYNAAPFPEDFDPGLLASVDFLLVNESEFAALVCRIDPGGQGETTGNLVHAFSDAQLNRLCQRLLAGQGVIITMGARGSFISMGERFRMLPGHRVDLVVDTVGAGDCWAGAFAAELLKNPGDPLAAARYANAAAALAVTRPGAIPAMPTRHAVERFLTE